MASSRATMEEAAGRLGYILKEDQKKVISSFASWYIFSASITWNSFHRRHSTCTVIPPFPVKARKWAPPWAPPMTTSLGTTFVYGAVLTLLSLRGSGHAWLVLMLVIQMVNSTVFKSLLVCYESAYLLIQKRLFLYVVSTQRPIMSHAVGFNQKNLTLFSQINTIIWTRFVLEVLPDIKNLDI